MAAEKADFVVLVKAKDEDIPNSQLDDSMKPRKWRKVEKYSQIFLVFAAILVLIVVVLSTLHIDFKTYYVVQFISENSPIGFINMDFYLTAAIGTVLLVVNYIYMDNNLLLTKKTWLSFLNVIGMCFGLVSFWGVLILASIDFTTLFIEPEKWDSDINQPLVAAVLSLYLSGGCYICLQLLLSFLTLDLDKDKYALRCTIYVLCVTCSIILTIYRVQIHSTEELLYGGSDVTLFGKNGFEKDDLMTLIVWLIGCFVWLLYVWFEDYAKNRPLPSKNSGHLKGKTDVYILHV